jgi:hypothetical protein
MNLLRQCEFRMGGFVGWATSSRQPTYARRVLNCARRSRPIAIANPAADRPLPLTAIVLESQVGNYLRPAAACLRKSKLRQQYQLAAVA